ncbi:MAG: hypothetical protein WBG50_08410 [Desulfomonilaceae bacterium]
MNRETQIIASGDFVAALMAFARSISNPSGVFIGRGTFNTQGTERAGQATLRLTILEVQKHLSVGSNTERATGGCYTGHKQVCHDSHIQIGSLELSSISGNGHWLSATTSN